MSLQVEWCPSERYDDILHSSASECDPFLRNRLTVHVISQVKDEVPLE